MVGFPSGQRGQTVNLLRLASVVRIHLHPFGFVPVMSNHDAGVAELADAQDLKSCGTNLPCRFDSGLRHCGFDKRALVAQLVEQRTENPRVTGSIPVQGIEKSGMSVKIFEIQRFS